MKLQYITIALLIASLFLLGSMLRPDPLPKYVQVQAISGTFKAKLEATIFDGENSEEIVDDNGKAYNFENEVRLLNYMAERGYILHSKQPTQVATINNYLFILE